MKRQLYCYWLFVILLFASCKKPGCFESAGAVTTVTLPVAPFEELVVNDNIDVIIRPDSLNQVIVEAPYHILPNIVLQVSANSLSVSNTTDCRWLRNADEKIRVTVSVRNLKKIDYRGSGNITNTGILRMDALMIESTTGAGNIELNVDNRYTGVFIYQENAAVILHGASQSCNAYTNPKGIIDFRDLVVRKMVIEYGGLRDTHVQVTDELDATIYYKGNLFYHGDPVITRQLYFSEGKLIHE